MRQINLKAVAPLMGHVRRKSTKDLIIYNYKRYPIAQVYDGPAPSGTSGAILVKCDNNKTYVVKFHPTDSSSDLKRHLFNEVVCSRLGEKMGLPIPEHSLIFVPQAFFDTNSSCIEETPEDAPTRTPGIHFGTLLLDRAYSLSRVLTEHKNNIQKIRASLINKSHLFGTIVFDIWTQNNDRSNLGNSLFKEVSETRAQYKYYQIDHGNSFTGPNWTEQSLTNSLTNMLSTGIFPDLHKHSISPGCFDKYLESIEQSFHTELFEKIVSEIPLKWEIHGNDRRAVLTFLLNRQAATRFATLSAFPMSRIRRRARRSSNNGI